MADHKKASAILLESTSLDPDMYRTGHTKARYFISVVSLRTPSSLSLISLLSFFLLILWNAKPKMGKSNLTAYVCLKRLMCSSQCECECEENTNKKKANTIILENLKSKKKKKAFFFEGLLHVVLLLIRKVCSKQKRNRTETETKTKIDTCNKRINFLSLLYIWQY